MRLLMMGTGTFAEPTFEALLAAGTGDVVGLVTQPERDAGNKRGSTRQTGKVMANIAEAASGLAIAQPDSINTPEGLAQLRELRPDLLVVAAYGQILSKDVLSIPTRGTINVHASLLPKYRGAAPIQRAILDGEAETGVTIMKMDVGMDTGDIVTQEKTPIQPGDNSQTLHDRLAQIGAELLVKTIPDIISRKIQPRPQPTDGVSHAAKIRKQDGKLDWTQPARAIWNRVRAMTPWPGAFTFLQTDPQPQLLKIWEAEPVELNGTSGEVLSADKSGIVIGCGTGSLRVLTLQREGGRRLSAQEFLAGHPLTRGQKFVDRTTG